MKSSQAEQIIEKINSTVGDIESFSNLTELERSYLAKFLVVFICGIYEEVIETIINERVERCNDSLIGNYIKKTVDKSFRNPDIHNIKDLLGRFNDDWKSEVSMLPQEAQTAMDNIIHIKNSLAHGINVSLTLNDAIQYYRESIVVINKIDDMLL